MRLQKFISTAFAIGIISFGISSCSDDYLEPTISTDKDLGTNVNTVADLEGIIFGAYERLSQSGFYGRDVIVHATTRSDDGYSNANSGRFIRSAEYNYQATDGDPSRMWSDGYETIANVNIIINAVTSDDGSAEVNHVKGEAYAVVSQDFDNLLFGSLRFVRNLSIEGRRKKTGKLGYNVVRPEIVHLSEVLNNLGIDQEQLIVLGILVGTDYNLGGIPGIGPKKGLKLVKEEQDFDKIFEKEKWGDYFDIDWKEVLYTIKDMPVSDDYKLEWNDIDVEGVRKLLVDEYDFSEERVDSKLKGFVKEQEGKKQTNLQKWS